MDNYPVWPPQSAHPPISCEDDEGEDWAAHVTAGPARRLLRVVLAILIALAIGTALAFFEVPPWQWR